MKVGKLLELCIGADIELNVARYDIYLLYYLIPGTWYDVIITDAAAVDGTPFRHQSILLLDFGGKSSHMA